MIRTLPAFALLALATPALAADPAPGEIVAAAPKADWVAIPASDLLVMDLAPDAKAKPRRVRAHQLRSRNPAFIDRAIKIARDR